MTLDKAIKHCEEVVYQKDLESGFDTDNERYAMTDKEREDCIECANEHRQLAMWLKDYKRLLEQQSEDCVSRADARHLIAESFRKNLLGITFNKMFETLYKGINDLPPVTPTQRWIPVSKRLPEESGNYLLYGKVVDYEENCVFIGEYDSDYEKFGYEENVYDSETLGFLDSEFIEYNKVIAWQPLPQAYEEKRGNGE